MAIIRGKFIILILCVLWLDCGWTQLSLDELINNVFSTKPTPIPNNEVKQSHPTLPPNRVGNDGKTNGFQNLGNTGNMHLTNQGGAYKSCGVEKECVPRHLCVDGVISTTGENFIDIRIDNDVCAYNEICCDLPNKRSTPVIPALPPEPHTGCGWRNVDGVGFRITGKVDESEFGEFPWMMAVLRLENNGGESIHLYECGGSLIAPNVVLTAAHCVHNRRAQQLVVRAGEWDTQNVNEILPHVDKNVKEIIVHEQYNKGTLYNDVALLILDKPYDWAENIRPICLPEPNMNFDRSNCIATGWGKDKFGREGKYQVILKKIELPIVPHSTCENNLRNTRLGRYFRLHESFLCAGGESNKDTCKGDGGSPLICPSNIYKNRYYQAGIVAWGIGCATDNVPGVYTNIPYLRNWISDKLISRYIDFSHFSFK